MHADCDGMLFYCSPDKVIYAFAIVTNMSSIQTFMTVIITFDESYQEWAKSVVDSMLDTTKLIYVLWIVQLN